MNSTRTTLGHAAWLLALFAAGCGNGSGQPTKACRPATSTTGQPLTASSSKLFLTTALVTRLQQRAAANDPAWVSLKKECDGYTTGTVYPPNGNAYPNSGSVGQGYQGDGYLPAIQALGLCYRTAAGVDDASAAKYASAGGKVLDAMALPPGSGGATPSTDSGYGIRNYGVGMAVGYDWLSPALSASTKSAVITALDSWIDWYDKSGFSRDQPIGNYFVGYFLAKTYTAIATAPDNAKAATYWSDVETHLWGQLVQPQYTAWMAGGGWPEGWEYGPRAVRGMVEVLWGVETGKSLDWYSQVPQARDQALYIEHFAWPSLKRMDDRGTVRSGVSLQPSAALMSSLATILALHNDPAAPAAMSFADDVVATSGDDRDNWQKFLYSDPATARSPYTTGSLSYDAQGPGNVAMRSSWDKTATWATLTAGRYINAPDSGEQLFDAGGVSVVAGGNPLLVNAAGWIPSAGGTAGEDYVYTDGYGGGGRRLYNTFFVADPSNPGSPGQNSKSPNSSKTHIERFEDGATYVRARAANLEDQYGSGSSHPVSAYTRDVVYMRPSTVVLYDRTTVASASADRWMAFHVPGTPTEVALADATQHRFDVTSGGAVRGSVRMLLPESPAVQTVALPGATTRIEVHGPGAASDEWLSVVTASASAPQQVRLSASDGNVPSANALGVEVHGSRDQVVLFPSDQSNAAQLSSVEYVVAPTADGDHVIVDVKPSASGYAVTATATSNGIDVSVTPGGTFQPSSAGVLSFQLSMSGAVSPGATVPPPSGSGGTGGTGGSGGGTAGTGGSGAGGTGGSAAGGTGGSAAGGTGGTGTGGTGGSAAGGTGGSAAGGTGGSGSGGTAGGTGGTGTGGSGTGGSGAGGAGTGGSGAGGSGTGGSGTGGSGTGGSGAGGSGAGGSGGASSGGAAGAPGSGGSGGSGSTGSAGSPGPCTDPAQCPDLPPC